MCDSVLGYRNHKDTVLVPVEDSSSPFLQVLHI